MASRLRLAGWGTGTRSGVDEGVSPISDNKREEGVGKEIELSSELGEGVVAVAGGGCRW